MSGTHKLSASVTRKLSGFIMSDFGEEHDEAGKAVAGRTEPGRRIGFPAPDLVNLPRRLKHDNEEK